MSKFGSRTTADQVLKDKDLSSKNIVVTGANTGIGYEAARALAAAGANVIFACRDKAKGLAAVARAKQAHPGCEAQFIQLDLSSFENIRNFCENYPFEKLDILIANAGLFSTGYGQTQDNIEATVGVCHLGHFLLTQGLMDKLLKANKPRIVMVSSESHRSPKELDFDNLPLKKTNYSAFTAYGQAKLCNVLFAKELQRRFEDKGLSACSLHPGTLITTDIGRNSFWVSLGMKIISPFTKTANQGASTSVYCAAYASETEIAGHYFSHCQKASSSRAAKSTETATRLWQLSEQLCAIYRPDN
ncbi:MAG: hypothetical protein COC19_02535 [SAR86 cluster bacterium]|uniref:Short-chain dehydrogenase n=1 Tax=SAR86 cluster bacterium TaxID=2030880 RepID=A0A2A4MR72_9GAMM|nr:MAG: hypothetical protein COC19_02535 [SAR86 cluster bacterium]